MSSELFLPIVRHLLQAVAGALAARGYIDDSISEAIIGLGVSVFTLVWWGIEFVIRKRREASDE